MFEELAALNIDYEGWNLCKCVVNLLDTPPEGIYYNKISASSYLRGNDSAIDIGESVIQWLETSGRTVINGNQTVRTEVSKARQSLLLQKHHLPTPKTLVTNSLERLEEASEDFKGKSFIVKPNKGGKGAGVQLFASKEELKSSIDENTLYSPDDIYILQEYIKPRNSQITRMEFIGGQFYYAVAVDTSDGFELCPADACDIEALSKPKFQIIPQFQFERLSDIESMLQEEKIDIAGIEFVENENGEKFIYDINTNTNYNSAAEEAFGPDLKGLKKVARYLQKKLREAYPA